VQRTAQLKLVLLTDLLAALALSEELLRAINCSTQRYTLSLYTIFTKQNSLDERNYNPHLQKPKGSVPEVHDVL
jgi:hypothetical protein